MGQSWALPCVVYHAAQVGLQTARAQQVATSALRAAVALLVVSPDRKPPLVQVRRDFAIASDVLAQAMHQQHGAQVLARRQVPVINRQLARFTLQG